MKIDKAKGGLDFAYPGLPKGKHVLTLRALDSRRESDAVDLPFWVEDEPFDYQDGLLYMMMLDRFANGDRSNDAPVAGPVHYDADWHGGDLQGALKVLQSGYFESLGAAQSGSRRSTSRPASGSTVTAGRSSARTTATGR